MNQYLHRLNIEVALYALLFGAALALRLVNLGHAPLSDLEASQALVVLDSLRGAPNPAHLPENPAYFFVTSLSFFVFGASDSAARLGPALLGAALALVPALARDRLSRGGALAAGAMLALCSSLLAASRSADGAVIAVFALALSLAAAWRAARQGSTGWLLVSGAALGLGLASGGVFLLGVLSIAAAALLVRWTAPAVDTEQAAVWAPLRARLPLLLAAAGLSALLIATVWFTYLLGVGALASSWLAGLRGFFPGAAGRAAALPPLFLLAYEPLLVVFGVLGGIRAFSTGHRLGQALAWQSLAALLLVMLYSGRQLSDVVWAAAPLAALAGWGLFELLTTRARAPIWPLVAAQTAVSLALAVFAMLNVSAYAEVLRTGRADIPIMQTAIAGRDIVLLPSVQLLAAVLALGLVAVVAYLFAMGWSLRSAQLGLLLSTALALFVLNLGAAVGLTQLRPHSPVELWSEQPAAADVRRLLNTLGDVSNYSLGHPHDIVVTVQTTERGALRWALRDFTHAGFVDRLAPEMNSEVVIAPLEVTNPTLGSSYVGQEFVLRSSWTPRVGPREWLAWFAFRRTTALEDDRVILWVRQDIQQLRGIGVLP